MMGTDAGGEPLVLPRLATAPKLCRLPPWLRARRGLPCLHCTSVQHPQAHAFLLRGARLMGSGQESGAEQKDASCRKQELLRSPIALPHALPCCDMARFPSHPRSVPVASSGRSAGPPPRRPADRAQERKSHPAARCIPAVTGEEGRIGLTLQPRQRTPVGEIVPGFLICLSVRLWRY